MNYPEIGMLIIPERIPEDIPVRAKVIFPIEPAMAMTLLKDNGFTPREINLNLFTPAERLAKAKTWLEQSNPDLLLILPPLLVFDVQEDYDLIQQSIKIAKARNPKVIVAMAGSFATSFPDKARDDLGADIILSGSFEFQVLNLAKRLRNPADTDTDSQPAPDMNLLPFPDYRGMNYQEYFNHPEKGNLRYPEKGRRFTTYQASRGCPGKCSFCNIPFLRGSSRIQHRSPSVVIEHLRRIKEDLNIEEVHFLDENITSNRGWALEMFAGMKALGLPWIPGAGINVYSMDDEILEGLRESGCYRITAALESGSQSIIDNIIHKPILLERDVARVEKAKKMGFEIICYLIIGFPGETPEERQATLDLAANPAFDYVTLSIASPLPGTRLAETGKAAGAVSSDYPERRHKANIGMDPVERRILEELRVSIWDKVNFSDPNRRLRLQRMFGVTEAEQDEIRRRTREAFEKRWAES